MTKYREILRLKSLGFSERNIAQSCGVSRNTVAKVLKKAAEINLSWPLDFDMTDSALEELMFPKDKSATNKRMPNFDYIRKELLRNGVNKKLLWVEYCEECRMSSEEPLMYSQFCYYIQKDEEKRRATMHIPRKPGEQIEVDWAGDPAHIIDPDTGEITDAWIFVGVLTYSQYAFVKAYMNEKTDNWIKAHVQMFDFFGGVTPMLVSDNCTTAVNHKKSDWYNTALNTTYHEMAEHYNLAILPARVRKPKDKPNVEGAVGKISTWITAALRNEQFFSLAELNASIREKLDAYNARKFQKKECSRLSLFLGEEMPLLAPLPATPFELAEWKQATVQFNYHIAVDRMFYSVPYQYIKNKVDVRITDTTVLLPKKRLEIIILSFFADMTDKEIGKAILMPKSSVQYNRNVALQYIRKMMEVYTEVNEKQKNKNEFFSQDVRKSIFGSKQKLKTKTILLAVSGDTEALMEVVDIYKPYIEKLSMRVVMDENGHCREMVDETVKRSLEVGLIAAIMKFHPYI